MRAKVSCPQPDEVQAAQAKLAFAAVLPQTWAHPELCNHQAVRGAAHPDYPLRGNAARFSADVLKGQRQECVTRQDGDVFSIHLHMHWSHEWPAQGRLYPALHLLLLEIRVHLTGLNNCGPIVV